MAGLIRPARWGLQKPPLGAQIDWSHPLAQGLALCQVFNEQAGRPVDLVSNSQSSAALGTWNDDTGYTGLYTPTAPLAVSAAIGGVFSLVVDTIIRSLTTTFQELLGCYSYTSESANNGAVLELRSSSSSTKGLAFQVFSNDAAATYAQLREAVPATGVRAQYAGIRNAAGASALYRNAVLLSSASPAYTAPASSAAVGAPGLGGAATTSLSLLAARIYSRALSQAELEWLTAEPYAFLLAASPRQRYWLANTVFPVTVSATTTTTAAVVRQRAAIVSAAASTTVVLGRTVARTLTAAAATAAAVGRQRAAQLAATVVTTPVVIRQRTAQLAATVTTTATVVKGLAFLRTVSATVGTSAVVQRTVYLARTVTVTPAVAVSRTVGRVVAAASSTTVAVRRTVGISRSATVTTTPTVSRIIGVTRSATLGLTASVATSVSTAAGVVKGYLAAISAVRSKLSGRPRAANNLEGDTTSTRNNLKGGAS